MEKHYYKITSKFGPADLFKFLKKITEASKYKEHAPGFEFEWMKRKIELTGTSLGAVEEMLEELIDEVNRRAGRGLLLPGETIEDDDRLKTPVGVLLQTPDVFAELICNALAEASLNAAPGEEDGEFAVQINMAARALNYHSFITTFPLPEYLKLEDNGIR